MGLTRPKWESRRYTEDSAAMHEDDTLQLHRVFNPSPTVTAFVALSRNGFCTATAFVACACSAFTVCNAYLRAPPYRSIAVPLGRVLTGVLTGGNRGVLTWVLNTAGHGRVDPPVLAAVEGPGLPVGGRPPQDPAVSTHSTIKYPTVPLEDPPEYPRLPAGPIASVPLPMHA